MAPAIIVPAGVSGGPYQIVGLTSAGGTTTTFNPADTAAGLTLSAGNLAIASGGTSDKSRSTANHSTGKYYCEAAYAGAAIYKVILGVADAAESLTVGDPGNTAHSAGLWQGDTNIYGNSNSVLGVAADYSGGLVLSMAVDVGAKLLWYRVNGGIWNNNGANDPAAGSGGAAISFLSGSLYVMGGANTATPLTVNFGGSTYSFTPPSGFGNW